MSEYEQKLWDDRKELEAKIDKRDKLIAEMAESYTAAQTKIKELEYKKEYLVSGYEIMMDEMKTRIEKLEQANKIMREALEEVRDKARSLTPYTSYAMECIADEALNLVSQADKILGE